MASFVDDPAGAINEAIDRVLRAQEYQIRGERVKRPDLDKLYGVIAAIAKLEAVSPIACSVGQIGCPTRGDRHHGCGCGPPCG